MMRTSPVSPATISRMNRFFCVRPRPTGLLDIGLGTLSVFRHSIIFLFFSCAAQCLFFYRASFVYWLRLGQCYILIYLNRSVEAMHVRSGRDQFETTYYNVSFLALLYLFNVQ